ncbi:MAG: hypothetical protein L0H84_09300 [Pseudonocardia sp.]|nr:hypothetical protein [Pseudonocardia sp.]
MSRCVVGSRRMAAADRFVLSLAVLPALGMLVTSFWPASAVVLAACLLVVLAVRHRRRRI